MSQHTPGPWFVGASGVTVYGGSRGCQIVQQDSEMLIGEKIANARLIAAAPELLAACLSFIDPGLSNDDSYKLVKAAIAKAGAA
jgi:hypothetical protein